MGIGVGEARTRRLSCATIKCVTVSMLLLAAVTVSVNSSSTKGIKADEDNTHAICSKKCSQVFKNIERQTTETCMLKCRNYIEETMFRPRSLENTKTSLNGARYSRAAGPRNHMFVRVGKSIDSQADSNEDSENSAAAFGGNDGEVTKRRNGGFVRIGRSGSAAGDLEDSIEEKRGASKSKGQAFVRIGRKAANFVRIGRAFVRIGKNSNTQEAENLDNQSTLGLMSYDE